MVWSATNGAEKVLASSTCTWYDAALVTSLQSSVTGSVTVAPFAGARSVGAAGTDVVPAFTVRLAVLVTPDVPEIVADVDDDTVCVLTVNVRLVLPAGTVTLAGTVATDGLLLDSVTTLPPDGAAPVNVTVPCAAVPPVTLVGLSESAESVGPLDAPGVTVSTAPHEVLRTAHSFAWIVELADDVLTGNVADVEPAGIVTVAGTDAGLMDDSCTVAPPVGAGALMTTVPVEACPAVTVAGLTLCEVTHTFTDGFTVTLALLVEAP
jgi:hypothetical protein